MKNIVTIDIVKKESVIHFSKQKYKNNIKRNRGITLISLIITIIILLILAGITINSVLRRKRYI